MLGKKYHAKVIIKKARKELTAADLDATKTPKVALKKRLGVKTVQPAKKPARPPRISTFMGKCTACNEYRPLTRHHIPSQAQLRNAKFKEIIGIVIPLCDKCHDAFDKELKMRASMAIQYEWAINTLRSTIVKWHNLPSEEDRGEVK